jgi:hypothetical protein
LAPHAPVRLSAECKKGQGVCLMQKIHGTLWDTVKQHFGADATLTFAEKQIMMIRPSAIWSAPIAVQFDPAVWDAIRAADERALTIYKRNIARIFGKRLEAYGNDVVGVFIVSIDDHALDE